jgi:hypothetical protein
VSASNSSPAASAMSRPWCQASLSRSTPRVLTEIVPATQATRPRHPSASRAAKCQRKASAAASQPSSRASGASPRWAATPAAVHSSIDPGSVHAPWAVARAERSPSARWATTSETDQAGVAGTLASQAAGASPASSRPTRPWVVSRHSTRAAVVSSIGRPPP